MRADVLSHPFPRPRLLLPPFSRWLRMARERRQLRDLNDRLLRDIGLDRAGALHEAARPFWDAPR